MARPGQWIAFFAPLPSAEIDRYWAALSEVPEAEACGWCADRFGVSWQVTPSNMAELMERPGAFQAMMGMKKLEIAAF